MSAALRCPASACSWTALLMRSSSRAICCDTFCTNGSSRSLVGSAGKRALM